MHTLTASTNDSHKGAGVERSVDVELAFVRDASLAIPGGSSSDKVTAPPMLDRSPEQVEDIAIPQRTLDRLGEWVNLLEQRTSSKPCVSGTERVCDSWTEAGLRLDASEEVDQSMVTFFNQSFLNGLQPNVGETTLAAWTNADPRHIKRGDVKLPLAWRCL